MIPHFIHKSLFHKELGPSSGWTEIGVKGQPLHPADMIRMEMGDVDCVNLFSKVMVVNIAFTQGEPCITSAIYSHLLATPGSDQHI